MIRLLEGLEHELHEHSPLLPWLTRSTVTGRMLGLPPTIRACVFDLEGVLAMSGDMHAAAWATTFDRFLLEQAHADGRTYVAFDPLRDYPELLAGRPRLDGIRAFLASRGIGLPDGHPDDPPGALTVHGLANRKNQLLRLRLARDGVAAFSGSRSYLVALRLGGLARAVVSASANSRAILERADLAQLIDVQVDGVTMETEQLRPKPEPDLLAATCRHLRVEPREAASFETTRSGIAAARAAGIGFVAAVHRHGQGELLRAGEADVLVGGLGDLLALDRG